MSRFCRIVMGVLFIAFLLVACAGLDNSAEDDAEGGDDSQNSAADDTAGASDDDQVHGTDFCDFVYRIGKGYRENCHGVTVIRVEGSPYEIGYQTGVLMRSEITGLIRFIRSYLDPFELVWTLAQDVAGRMEDTIKPEYVEEMQGMADGLNNEITYEEIMAGNCLGDVFGAIRAFLDNYTDVDWCSVTASWGEATADGEIIFTRNFDYMNAFSTNNYVSVVKPDSGHSFVTTGIAGITGIHTGMNDAGLTGALAYNASYDSDMRGVPMLLLLREAIQYSDTIEEAESLIEDSPRTMGLNYLFADGSGAYANILETSGEKWAIREATDEKFLVTTNHYVHPDMLDQQRGYDETHTSMVRYARLTELLRQYYGRIDLQAGGAIMTDHWDSVAGEERPGRVTICRHDDVEYEPGSLMNTFVSTSTPSILAKPSEGEYCTTVTRHACERPFFCFHPWQDNDYRSMSLK